MSRSLKLHPPASLPTSGVTSVSFKAWKQTLVAYLEQDTVNFLFLPGGLYANWRARGKNALRIPEIIAADPKRTDILNRLARATQARDLHPDNPHNDQYDGAARDADLAELLTSRNSQLSKFITHITMLCPYTLTNNISQISTSFDWINTYLEQYYNIRKQGAHFFSINSIRYTAGDSYQNFYMELHGALEDSLRKEGAVLLYKNNDVLEEDEELSPTLENFIVLTWLERIDPRLPDKTAATFGHQITGNTSLRDLQPEICVRIPAMLQELDEASANRAAIGAAAQDASVFSPTPVHAAISFQRVENTEAALRPHYLVSVTNSAAYASSQTRAPPGHTPATPLLPASASRSVTSRTWLSASISLTFKTTTKRRTSTPFPCMSQDGMMKTSHND